jgi:hypothetical protein
MARRENTQVAFNDELMTLVNEVADRVDRWTGQAMWSFDPARLHRLRSRMQR